MEVLGGTIDKDHSGEVQLVYRTRASTPQTLTKGIACAQIVLLPTLYGQQQADEDETLWSDASSDGNARGSGGVGSSDARPGLVPGAAYTQRASAIAASDEANEVPDRKKRRRKPELSSAGRRRYADETAKLLIETVMNQKRDVTDADVNRVMKEWAFHKNPDRQNVTPDDETHVPSDIFGLSKDEDRTLDGFAHLARVPSCRPPAEHVASGTLEAASRRGTRLEAFQHHHQRRFRV